jgi:hypothetical protein
MMNLSEISKSRVCNCFAQHSLLLHVSVQIMCICSQSDDNSSYLDIRILLKVKC